MNDFDDMFIYPIERIVNLPEFLNESREYLGFNFTKNPLNQRLFLLQSIKIILQNICVLNFRSVNF